jgi:hypothetical protein
LKKQQVLAILILVAVISTASLCQAQVSKPNVTLPSGWQLNDETAYPDAPSEHDSAGAGYLEFLNPTNNDEVRVYYEKAPSTAYTSATLKSEAESLFQRDLSSYTMTESGTQQVAGVQAGFAKGYDSENDAYIVDIVFVKDSYYINAAAYYDANSQSEQQVNSLLNSISAGGAGLGGSMLFIIIGVVVAIVVIVVVVVVVRKRKKPATMEAPQMMPEGSYPPPPPPA